MEVILIFRQLTVDEVQSVSAAASAGAHILSLPGINHGISFNVDPIPDELIKKAIKELNSTIRNLGDKQINGVSISSLLYIYGIPLWHYQRFRTFFLLRSEWIINQCIEHYSNLTGDLTIYLPESVQILTSLKQKGIQFITHDNSSNVIITHKRNYKALFNYFIFFALRIVITLFRHNNLKSKKHVVIDRSARQQCRNIVTLEKKWDNHNLYPLFDKKPNDLLIISEVETPKLRSDTPFILRGYFFNGEGRSKNTLYGEWILLKGLLSIKVAKKRKTIIEEYAEKVSLIRIALSKRSVNTAENSDAELSRVFEIYSSLMRSSRFYIFKYLCYYRYFEKYNFNTVSAIDENSPATKCILDAARFNSIKTIGIQHGNIGESQPAYLYTAKDRENRVIADLTVVWGEYFRDILIEKGNFTAESVKTAGQMRSDLIPRMIEMSEIYKRELSPDKRVVTFASQPIADENYRYQMAYNVFDCFKNHPEIRLILKLHPGERHSYEYYRNIALAAGYTNADIRYEVDLYELLSISDIVITAYSTVGSEAVYFGKPLIIYDPFREDLLNYVKEGVAFMATDNQSLKLLVDDILSGQLKPDAELYSKFIRKYAYAIDGKATERTLSFITSS